MHGHGDHDGDAFQASSRNVMEKLIPWARALACTTFGCSSIACCCFASSFSLALCCGGPQGAAQSLCKVEGDAQVRSVEHCEPSQVERKCRV